MNVSANDSWNAWSTSGNVNWNTNGGIRLGYNWNNWGASGTATLTKTFYIPADVDVVVNSTGTHRGSGGTSSRYQTTFSITVSGTSIFSSTSTSGDETSFSCSGISGTMTSSTPTIILKNSRGTGESNSTVKSLSIHY